MRSILFALLLVPVLALAGTAKLTCTPPTTNTDNTALTDLAGYRFFWGTSPTALTQTWQVANPANCTTTVTGLAPGTWYFGVKAYNTAGGESVLSNVVSKVIDAPPPSVPNPPGGLTVTITSLTAYTVIKRVDRFVMLPVGTVPADTPCDPAQQVNGYFAVPRAKVQWAGDVKPDVVVAQCS